MVADNTDGNKFYAESLEILGQPALPFNLVVGPAGPSIKLPQNLTQKIVLDAIVEATNL